MAPPHCNRARAHAKFHSGRRAIIVDLALSVTGSQLIASVLPNVSRPPHPPGLYLTATSSGRQGPAHSFVRVDSWAYRHTPWLQDRFEGHLVIVSNVAIWGMSALLIRPHLSDRMVNFLLVERSHVSDCDSILERAYYGY